MSFAIDAARPIAAAAQQVGVKPLYAALPSYVIIMGGGALVNFAYCFARLAYRKDISVRSDWSQTRRTLLLNTCLAATPAQCGISSSSSMPGVRRTFLRI